MASILAPKLLMDKKTSAQTLIIAVLKKYSVVWYIIPSIVSYQKVILVIWKLRRKKTVVVVLDVSFSHLVTPEGTFLFLSTNPGL